MGVIVAASSREYSRIDPAILARIPKEMRERFADNFAAAGQAQANANAEAFRENAARREHLHQHQHHRQQQQQQQQEQQLWQHQQHYNATAKQTSDVLRVEARADREDTQAENGGAPPTSQTTSKPPSVCEYPVVLSALQPVCSEPSSIDDELLDSMENGLLEKRAEIVQEKRVEKSFQEPEKPRQSLQAEQPRPCLREEEAGKGDMGVLGKDLVVTGGLAVSAGGAGVEEERPPPSWDDDTFPVSWLAPDQTELEIEIVYARKSLPAVSRGNKFVGDGKVVMENGGKVVLGEDGEHAPPLLQQQQELQAAPPQEPWPPPRAAEQVGSGAGTCGEDGLGLEGFSITRLDFSPGCGSDDILSCGKGYCKESSGKGDDEEDTVDGRVWERVGIGTGARSRVFWGSEVALRRLTQRRRERVREK